MSDDYFVVVEKEYLVFSAAHFITFDGDVCERLHGHNWRVSAEVHGPLDENQYVIDFIFLRDALRQIIDQFDHRMLLPSDHPLIQVAARDGEYEVTFAERRWIFPQGDCVVLPVANTTAEQIAKVIGQRLLGAIRSRLGQPPSRMRIGVDENHGQWGNWVYQA